MVDGSALEMRQAVTKLSRGFESRPLRAMQSTRDAAWKCSVLRFWASMLRACSRKEMAQVQKCSGIDVLKRK